MGPAWLVVACVLAGCYSPSASPGAPCSPQGDCPSGLECLVGVCQLPGTLPVDSSLPVDLAVIDAVEIEVDADTPVSDAPGDAMPDAPPDAPLRMPEWGPPVGLGISGTDPTLGEARLRIAFVRANGSNEQIFYGTRGDVMSPFTASALDIVNSPQADHSPELTSNGMYFTSLRGGDFDVYFAEYFFGMWLNPTVVAELSDPTLDDNDIAIAPNQLAAIVVRTDGTGVRSFWLATRTSTFFNFDPPVRLPDLEISTDISGPTLTNNATTIYFHAGANRDLFVAHKTGTGYDTPEAVTELNTAAREAAPFVDQNESFLVFERAGSLLEAPHL